MGDVVSISEPSPYIWVCGCGCSTFELHSDGIASCAACYANANVDHSGWSSWTGKSAHDEASAFSDVQWNGDFDFPRRRVAAMASDKTAQLLLVVREDGSFSLWSAAKSNEQIAWAKRKLRAAAALLKRKGA